VLDVGNVIFESRDDAFNLTALLFQPTGFPFSRLKLVKVISQLFLFTLELLSEVITSAATPEVMS
jgi:hypothetical protein